MNETGIANHRSFPGNPTNFASVEESSTTEPLPHQPVHFNSNASESAYPVSSSLFDFNNTSRDLTSARINDEDDDSETFISAPEDFDDDDDDDNEDISPLVVGSIRAPPPLFSSLHASIARPKLNASKAFATTSLSTQIEDATSKSRALTLSSRSSSQSDTNSRSLSHRRDDSLDESTRTGVFTRVPKPRDVSHTSRQFSGPHSNNPSLRSEEERSPPTSPSFVPALNSASAPHHQLPALSSSRQTTLRPPGARPKYPRYLKSSSVSPRARCASSAAPPSSSCASRRNASSHVSSSSPPPPPAPRRKAESVGAASSRGASHPRRGAEGRRPQMAWTVSGGWTHPTTDDADCEESAGIETEGAEGDALFRASTSAKRGDYGGGVKPRTKKSERVLLMERNMAFIDTERRVLTDGSTVKARGSGAAKNSSARRAVAERGSVDDSIESGCDQTNEGRRVSSASRQKSRRLLTDPSRLPTSPSSAIPKTNATGHSNLRNRHHSKRATSGAAGDPRQHRRPVGMRAATASRGIGLNERDPHSRYHHRHFPREEYNRHHRPPLNRRIVAAPSAVTAVVKHGDSAAESSSESEDESKDIDAVSPSQPSLPPSSSLPEKSRHRTKRLQSIPASAVPATAGLNSTSRHHGRQLREHSTSFSRHGRFRYGLFCCYLSVTPSRLHRRQSTLAQKGPCVVVIDSLFPPTFLFRNSQQISRNNQPSSNDENPPRPERRRRNVSGSRGKYLAEESGEAQETTTTTTTRQPTSSRSAESRLAPTTSHRSKRKSSDDQDSASTSRTNAPTGIKVAPKSSLMGMKLQTSEKRENESVINHVGCVTNASAAAETKSPMIASSQIQNRRKDVQLSMMVRDLGRGVGGGISTVNDRSNNRSKMPKQSHHKQSMASTTSLSAPDALHVLAAGNGEIFVSDAEEDEYGAVGNRLSPGREDNGPSASIKLIPSTSLPSNSSSILIDGLSLDSFSHRRRDAVDIASSSPRGTKQSRVSVVSAEDRVRKNSVVDPPSSLALDVHRSTKSKNGNHDFVLTPSPLVSSETPTTAAEREDEDEEEFNCKNSKSGLVSEGVSRSSNPVQPSSSSAEAEDDDDEDDDIGISRLFRENSHTSRENRDNSRLSEDSSECDTEERDEIVCKLARRGDPDGMSSDRSSPMLRISSPDELGLASVSVEYVVLTVIAPPSTFSLC